MKAPRLNKNLPWVGVCLTPALINQFDLENAIVVVIDVLRATSCMLVAFDHGIRSMIPVLTVEEGKAYQGQGLLAAAERDGEKIDGFDFGNSPYSYMRDDIKGKDIAITTTNGTKAIRAAVELNAKEIVVGSFGNITALTEYLVQKGDNVVLLCAGWKDKPNLEDTAFAGAVVKKLRGTFNLYEDAALIAETLYRNANRRKRFYLRNSSHFNRLYHKLKIQEDVKYSLRRDMHPVIPKLVGDHLVEINSPYMKEFLKKQKEDSKKKDLNEGEKVKNAAKTPIESK